MTNLVFLPFLIPFLTAIVCLALWRNQAVQRIVSLIGATLLLVVPISLAAIHQAVAMLLFTVALFVTHALKQTPIQGQ